MKSKVRLIVQQKQHLKLGEPRQSSEHNPNEDFVADLVGILKP